MPTYEYQCNECGAVFDVFQSIKASPLRKTHCESCGAVRPVRRLIGSGGAVLFKGSGFYQTDYRSEAYKKAAKAASESSGKKAPDGEKGGSAKAEPSGEAKSKSGDTKSTSAGKTTHSN